MVARSEIGVGVLARAVAILDVVESSPMGASDLARELDLSLSTTYRLATDMVKHGLLRKDQEGRFYLGQRFVTTALSDLAIPALRELSEATGESAQLWVRRGESRLCAASVDSQHELRVALPVGTLVPLPQGSSGHVLSGDWEADPEAVKSGWWVSVSERRRDPRPSVRRFAGTARSWLPCACRAPRGGWGRTWVRRWAAQSSLLRGRSRNPFRATDSLRRCRTW